MTELFTTLVENDTVFVHVFSLANDRSCTLSSSFTAHASCSRSVTTKSTHRLRSKFSSRHGIASTHALGWFTHSTAHVLSHRVSAFRQTLLLSQLRCGHHVTSACVALLPAKLVGVLNQVVSVLFCAAVFILPFVHGVGWRFVLEAAEDSLVFNRDTGQFFLAAFPIQTHHFITFRVVKFGAVVLHNVAHFLKKNAILTLDIGILALSVRFSLGFALDRGLHEWRPESFTNC